MGGVCTPSLSLPGKDLPEFRRILLIREKKGERWWWLLVRASIHLRGCAHLGANRLSRACAIREVRGNPPHRSSARVYTQGYAQEGSAYAYAPTHAIEQQWLTHPPPPRTPTSPLLPSQSVFLTGYGSFSLPLLPSREKRKRRRRVPSQSACSFNPFASGRGENSRFFYLRHFLPAIHECTMPSSVVDASSCCSGIVRPS